ncbi:hypothetical protein EWM64_g9299 [Hericium alpestre]|uniref:DUF155 domain-containing protein n=1 Tax=Hericium alpestre TaxID=135208 RepID=A0A4Y9ZJT3_9AGAM|nr:hypothetical protein EWM64_g9299 [Hericium alpestre]
MKFFNARRTSYHTNPRKIDDVIYTPYIYDLSPRSSPHEPRPPSKVRWQSDDHQAQAQTGDLLGVPELRPTSEAEDHQDTQTQRRKRSKFDQTADEAEIFLFPFGTVVIWGMTEAQEKRFLSSLKRFEVEKLAPQDVEMEDLNFYYANYSRIYNDVITLRKGSGYMTKLSLSHALAQSVKISLFEELISTTIEETHEYPEIISETGKIGLSHKEIMKKMGEKSFGYAAPYKIYCRHVDALSQTYPDLQPLYEAARSYLELPQRIGLLNTRVEVLQDMLQLLKESVSSRHAERLEQVVIALIAIEIGMPLSLSTSKC